MAHTPPAETSAPPAPATKKDRTHWLYIAVIASVVLTDPAAQTLAVGLYGYVSETRSENWGVFAAGAVLAALPVMALFLFLQKYIVSGLTAGGVKG